MANSVDLRRVTFNADQLDLYSEMDIGLFCLSDYDVSIILSCLRPAEWTARWYGDDGKRLRDTGRQAELEIHLERVERLIDRLMVDKCSDLTSLFGSLTDALNNLGSGGGCGCGSSGAGGTDDTASVADWGDINNPPDPDDPPDGFDSWIEYRSYKCDVATLICDNLLTDVQWFQTVGLVTLTLAGLALAIVTPIPGDELFALLGVLAVLGGFGSSALDDWESAIVNVFDDLVCALYNANNAGQARADFTTVINDQIDIEASSAVVGGFLKYATSKFINYTNVNNLFVRNTYLEPQLPIGDCSGCGVPQWWDCSFGTVQDWAENYVEIEAVLSGGAYLASIGKSGATGFSSAVIGGTWTPPSVVPTFATAVENHPPSIGSCTSGSGSTWDVQSSSYLGGPHGSATYLLHRSETAFAVRFTKLT